MSQSWIHQAADYLDRLQENIETLERLLEKTKVDTTACDQQQVDADTARLRNAAEDLEKRIAEREQLLSAEDAPQGGSTLTEKLRCCKDPQHQRLAGRCEEMSQSMERTNLRAVSLFVCQYQLADLSAEIIRLVSGTPAPPTYGHQSDRSSGGEGIVFNEAA